MTAPARLIVLPDALEEAGCPDADIFAVQVCVPG